MYTTQVLNFQCFELYFHINWLAISDLWEVAGNKLF